MEPETQPAETEEVTLSPFLQSISQPLSADAPGGEDVTYDQRFQDVKAEIDKMATADADSVDFKLVISQSQELLTGVSKDVRVATFLTVAESRLNGVAGMSEAVQATQLIVTEFWDDLYPPKRRMNARRNALQFMSDRMKDWVSAYKPSVADKEPLEQAHAAMKQLQEFCMKVMEDKAPALSGFTTALQTTLHKVPKPPPKPAAQEAPAQAAAVPATGDGAAAAPTPAASPAATAAPVASMAPAAELQSVKQAQGELIRIATYIRSQDTAHPLSYHILRSARWAEIQFELPNDAGKTIIPVPPAPRRNALQSMLSRGDHRTLLQQAEGAFQEPPFHLWLDLQRLSAAALEGMGPTHKPALDAVLYQTSILISRVPGLARLAYKDGTPFADAMTLDWIETQIKPLGGGGGGGGLSAEGGSSHLRERFDEARKKLTQGKLDEALTTMQEGVQEDATRQDHFTRRLYIAELCVKGGQPAMASPMLEALAEQVQHHDLNKWAPGLALQVWSNLYQSYVALAKGAEPEERETLRTLALDAFGQVCQLDASFALTQADSLSTLSKSSKKG
ncbi:MAG: type VI secretion system protein TssA [Bacteroidota bacterium]